MRTEQPCKIIRSYAFECWRKLEFRIIDFTTQPIPATTTATATFDHTMTTQRCTWANPANPLYLAYHDHEWGRPCHDERTLFAMLNLEGAQAGLSWETILNKRENYRIAFDDWDAHKIASYDEAKVASLLANPGIVRNRLKVQASISNARAYLRLCEEAGSLNDYLWGRVGHVPVQNTGTERIITSALSDEISKDLKKRGFKFVGSTIIYAYLQSMGIVNDHDHNCFCRA
jgi:DNA-3-methyladenine glycosylase I